MAGQTESCDRHRARQAAIRGQRFLRDLLPAKLCRDVCAPLEQLLIRGQIELQNFANRVHECFEFTTWHEQVRQTGSQNVAWPGDIECNCRNARSELFQNRQTETFDIAWKSADRA